MVWYGSCYQVCMNKIHKVVKDWEPLMDTDHKKLTKNYTCDNNEQHIVDYYSETKQKVCRLCGEQIARR